jgi:hypothetical protein
MEVSFRLVPGGMTHRLAQLVAVASLPLRTSGLPARVAQKPGCQETSQDHGAGRRRSQQTGRMPGQPATIQVARTLAGLLPG